MKRSIFCFLVFSISYVSTGNQAEAGWFAAMSQKVIYDTIGGEGTFKLDKNGVEVKYSYTGTKVLGVKNECQLAWTSCDSEKQNVQFLDGTIIFTYPSKINEK